MNQDDLKKRLIKFALRTIKLSENLPDNITGNTIAKKIIRTGTSPSANTGQLVLVNQIKIF